MSYIIPLFLTILIILGILIYLHCEMQLKSKIPILPCTKEHPQPHLDPNALKTGDIVLCRHTKNMTWKNQYLYACDVGHVAMIHKRDDVIRVIEIIAHNQKFFNRTFEEFLDDHYSDHDILVVCRLHSPVNDVQQKWLDYWVDEIAPRKYPENSFGKLDYMKKGSVLLLDWLYSSICLQGKPAFHRSNEIDFFCTDLAATPLIGMGILKCKPTLTSPSFFVGSGLDQSSIYPNTWDPTLYCILHLP